MGDPTAAQRRMFAKMGLAMPDGSFYIRNGAVGATDLGNAIRAVGRGEADGGNGNDIRRHIMKRASALKLSDKIPDTWNPDGSLKHGDPAQAGRDFLAHHGVKGMHWGVHRGRSSGGTAPAKGGRAERKVHKQDEKRKTVADKIKYHENSSAELTKGAQEHLRLHEDLLKNGFKSKAAIDALGKDASSLSSTKFYLRYGTTKPEALRSIDYQLRNSHNQLQHLANAHAKRAAKLKKKNGLEHADEIEIMSPEEAIEHFGVKGMHWGVRRSHGSSEPPSSDAARAEGLHSRAKSGGTKTLSNEELQHLVTRLNLETQYSRLSPEKVSPGKKIVGDILVGVGKQQATSYANKYAAQGIEHLVKKAAK